MNTKTDKENRMGKLREYIRFLGDICAACEYDVESLVNGEHCGPCRLAFAEDRTLPNFTFKAKKGESMAWTAEVTADVPLDLLRHIYFALCAAKQKDPDSVQLAYLLDNLGARWPDCTTKYSIPVDMA